MGANLLEGAYSADLASLFCSFLMHIYISSINRCLGLAVDSLGLYGTFTTLREGIDYHIRPIVSLIHYSFDNGEISTL